MKGFLAGLALIAACWVAGAWLLMITVGVIHAEWIPALPTISFPVSLLVGFLLLGRGLLSAVGAGLMKMIIDDK